MNLPTGLKKSIQKNVLLFALAGSLVYLIYRDTVMHPQERHYGETENVVVDKLDVTADSRSVHLRGEDLRRLLNPGEAAR